LTAVLLAPEKKENGHTTRSSGAGSENAAKLLQKLTTVIVGETDKRIRGVVHE